MGQILSWFRGSSPQDEPGLRDVSVEEQSQSGATPKPAAAVATFEVQVEVPPKAAESTKAQAGLPLDPLDALASSLPSEAPKQPEVKYSGPEVTEPPVPADAKPIEVPKPISTADALDLLSEGFESPQKTVETISAASTAPSNFAPAPTKDSASAAAAAVDKKSKMAASPAPAPSVTSPSSDLSLDALNALGGLLPSAEPPKPEPALRPDLIVVEATVEDEEAVRVGEREDTLPPEYRLKPEEIGQLPALKPQPSLDTTEALDILSGDLCDSSSAASTQKVQLSPAPPADKKPRMESDVFSLEAGLTSSSAQKVESSVLPPGKKKTETKTKTETKKDAKPSAAQSDLSLDALNALGGLLPSAEPPKPEPALRPDLVVVEATVEDEEAVRVGEREDTLPPEYRLKPEEIGQLPALKPQPSLDTTEALDILSGDLCDSSSAASTQTAAVQPSAPPAESLSALDALSQDFVSPSKGAAVQASTPPSDKVAKSSSDAALDALAGDFVAPSAAATTLQSLPSDDPLGAGADSALDALSDVLKDITPTPQPEPPMPKDIVKEKQIEEERLIKMGERDDTLPPEYRLTEEEKMQAKKNKKPETPKEKQMDDKTALDLLAGDFSCPAPASSASTQVSSSASTQVSSSASTQVSSSASAPVSSAPPADSQKPMSGNVLDSLSDTLLPDTLQKTEKPKAKSKSRSRTKKAPAEGATDLLSAQLSSDVLPSTKS